MPPGPRATPRLLLAMALGASALAAPRPAAGADEPACVESFGRFERAFESRSAEAVVGCMPQDGTLTVALQGVAGRAEPMKREQALKVLKRYFEQVTSARLKAREGQTADSPVRAYDYTRRLRTGDPTTTRLTITLKKDAGGALRLHALIESPR